MDILFSLLIGYVLGSLNPAALISLIKGVDIRNSGTKNLGATNTMLSFGKCAGLLVMFFDIGKAYTAYKLAQTVFPAEELSGLLAGCAAVVGHIFPFYLRFRGGKGLASLGGLILAFDPDQFLLLLGIGVALMIITDISITLQLSVALLFPLFAFLRTGSSAVLMLCLAVCVLMLVMHRKNISDALHGEAVSVRGFSLEHLSGRQKKQ